MLYPTLPPLPFVPRERKAALPVPSSLCWCVCLPISPSPRSSPLPPKASVQQVGSLAHLPVLEKGGGKGPSLVSQAFGLRQSPAVPRVPGREHPPPACWSWDLPLGLCSPPPQQGSSEEPRGGGLCVEGDQLWRWGDAVPGVVLCQWGAGGGAMPVPKGPRGPVICSCLRRRQNISGSFLLRFLGCRGLMGAGPRGEQRSFPGCESRAEEPVASGEAGWLVRGFLAAARLGQRLEGERPLAWHQGESKQEGAGVRGQGSLFLPPLRAAGGGGGWGWQSPDAGARGSPLRPAVPLATGLSGGEAALLAWVGVGVGPAGPLPVQRTALATHSLLSLCDCV